MANKKNGFSMMEMIIVIGIIAILASLITPLAVNYISQKRYDVCNDELKIIKQAIIGDPTLVEGGTRSSFGFVGDLGQLPAILDDLITQGAMPSWNPASNVYFGWRGPYISDLNDPWGKAYIYTIHSPPIDTIIVTIFSQGQDGISGNTDDVSITIREDEAFSMISGNSLDTCGAGAAFTNIQVFYPAVTAIVGTPVNTVNTVLTAPHYNIQTAIPIGIRYISVGNPAMNKLIYINNGPLTIVNLRTPGACN